ncbi:MAG TPA: hypothetical protein VI461_06880 [Chitinophagaceae bacterium]|nr:hypothetical protein [Chitinophagaceae bacterium]
MAFILLAILFCLKPIEGLLSYECLKDVRQKARVIDEYIHSLDYKIDAEQTQNYNLSMNEIYFLTANDGSQWIFKVHLSPEEMQSEMFAYRFYEYSGIPVPWAGYFSVVINGRKRMGILTQFVHITKTLDYEDGLESLSKYNNLSILSPKQSTTFIKSLFAGWILFGNAGEIEFLVTDDVLYTIDFANALGLPTENSKDFYYCIERHPIRSYIFVPPDEMNNRVKEQLDRERFAWQELINKIPAEEKRVPFEEALNRFLALADKYENENLPISLIFSELEYQEILPYFKAFNRYYGSTFLPWDNENRALFEGYFQEYGNKLDRREINGMITHILKTDLYVFDTLAKMTTSNDYLKEFFKERRERIMPFLNYYAPSIIASPRIRFYDTSILYRMQVHQDLKRDMHDIRRKIKNLH